MALTANDQVISELAAWQDRLALVSRNLAEINELRRPEYVRRILARDVLPERQGRDAIFRVLHERMDAPRHL